MLGRRWLMQFATTSPKHLQQPPTRDSYQCLYRNISNSSSNRKTDTKGQKCKQYIKKKKILIKTHKTKSARLIDMLGIRSDEPPIITQKNRRIYEGQELAQLVLALQRKLEKFFAIKPAGTRLETIWTMYTDIRISDRKWRISSNMAKLFLDAVLQSGVGTVWCKRAEIIASNIGPSIEIDVTKTLLRVYAKFGDVHKFTTAAEEANKVHGDGWVDKFEDYVGNRAIVYARAGLPVQAQQILDSSDTQNYAKVGNTKKKESYGRALQEILVAWTRARKIEEAWETLAKLNAIGYGRSSREWNALLYMHVVDVRYQYDLLEQVLARMREAGVTYNKKTYNIMMHGCLLRGKQAQWKDWFNRMEAKGFQPDTYTYNTLVSQLINSGQWSEASNIISHMRSKKGLYTSVTHVAQQTMEKKRGNLDKAMSQFKRNVVLGKHIAVQEFSQAMAIALENPTAWTAEIALLIGCLEGRRIEESAVVDTMATRLPGLTTAGIQGRSLSRALRHGPELVGAEILHSIKTGSTDLPYLGTGPYSRSYPETIEAVVRALLNSGKLIQAEELVKAAGEAKIEIGSPHTLIALLKHSLSQTENNYKPSQTLMDRISTVRIVPPTKTATAFLVKYVERGDLEAARPYFEQVERMAEEFPSIQAFNALLFYAKAAQNVELLNRKWQQMEVRGVQPDIMSHKTRIFCYSHSADLLGTRRAYMDMLDRGLKPTAQIVGAMVRSCVRSDHLNLAIKVVNAAEIEFGVPLNTLSYNYILSHASGERQYIPHVEILFDAMISTPDRRLVHEMGDTVRRVDRQRARFGDLTALPELSSSSRMDGLGGWIQQSREERSSSSQLRKALVSWLTSWEAFPGAPTLHGNKADMDDKLAHKYKRRRADPPPPDATTFIIMMRSYGQQGRWTEVIHAWEALNMFNQRIDKLAEVHPHAHSHRIVPFSRMVGWTALAMTEIGNTANANKLWLKAARDGILTSEMIEQGMEAMLGKLPVKENKTHSF